MSLIECMSAAALMDSGSQSARYGWGVSPASPSSDLTRGSRTYLSFGAVEGRYVNRTFPAQLAPNEEYVVFGWATRPSGSGKLFDIFNASSDYSIFRITLAADGSITMNTQNGIGTSYGITPPSGSIITIGSWNYIEVKIKMVSTEDVSVPVTIKINGTAVYSNTPTFNFASNSIRKVVWNGIANDKWMDAYVLNTLGSVNNDFLGDCRVEHLTPTSVGTHDQWILGAGSTKLSAVQTPSDDDSGYIKSDVSNARQTFVMTDLLATSGVIKAVCPTSAARGANNGNQKVGGTVRSAGVSTDSTTYTVVPNSAYGLGQAAFELNPVTGLAWTAAEVNALEAGPLVLP